MRRRPETRLRADPGAARDLLARLEGPGGVDWETLDDERRHQLMLAVSALDDDEQWLLFAIYRHGRGQAEVADDLGVTAKSVESRLYRLRARLRQMLRDIDTTE